MRTFAFVLFAVVTAAAAALSTLVASRYLTLEKELAQARSHMEDVQRERKRQEEEKMALRLEFERQRADLEARFAEQRGQLEECSTQRQRDFQELLSAVGAVNRRLNDALAQSGAHAGRERPGAAGETAVTDPTAAPAADAQPAAASKTGQDGQQPPAPTKRPDGQPAAATGTGHDGSSGAGQGAGQPAKRPASQSAEPKPASSTDVPKGAVPTPDQEARKLQGVH